MTKTVQQLCEEDFLTFAEACKECGIPREQVFPPAGEENHRATRLHIVEKWYETQFGAVIGRDYYLVAIADLKKAGAFKANPGIQKPSGVGVMFKDSEDKAINAIPDSVFADPRDTWNKSVDEAQALRERRAMQTSGQLETPRHPDAAIPGLKSETEQVIRNGRISYGETERLQTANREHNNHVRAEHAAAKGKK